MIGKKGLRFGFISFFFTKPEKAIFYHPLHQLSTNDGQGNLWKAKVFRIAR